MIANAIEREIVIEAPAETVYRVITEPDQISQWFSDAATLDPRPGGEGMLIFEDRATSQRATVRLRVEAAEPPHRFAFRWDYPDGAEPHAGNSLLVEFTLIAEGAGTRLRVTETGFHALERPEQEKAAYYEAHDKGWDVHVGNLRDHVIGGR
ncbi:MAG TPA: SRPBCC family protein [Streptosporangiaceae bacterium]